MSYGKMNQFIEFVRTATVKNERGIKVDERDTTIAIVRAYVENRHGNEMWANRAIFSKATHLFRFRAIPGVDVTPDMTIIFCDRRYNILSVEDVRFKGMYVEALAEVISPSKGG